MAETWAEFVRRAVEQPMADWERVVLRTEPSGRAASLDVYLNILRNVSINISNNEPVKTHGAGPLTHLDEFLNRYIERVEKLRDDKELSGLDSSVLEAYFLLSKHLSAYKGSALPFEFLETPAPSYKNEKMIQEMLNRYPELNSVITGRAESPAPRSAPAPESVVDSHAVPARLPSSSLSQLVPSRAEKMAGEEESRRRPNRPKQLA
jgi:hypothetical protein